MPLSLQRSRCHPPIPCALNSAIDERLELTAPFRNIDAVGFQPHLEV
jgi:hypothetical protein